MLSYVVHVVFSNSAVGISPMGRSWRSFHPKVSHLAVVDESLYPPKLTSERVVDDCGTGRNKRRNGSNLTSYILHLSSPDTPVGFTIRAQECWFFIFDSSRARMSENLWLIRLIWLIWRFRLSRWVVSLTTPDHGIDSQRHLTRKVHRMFRFLLFIHATKVWRTSEIIVPTYWYNC